MRRRGSIHPSTRPRRPSGMPSVRPDDPRWPSWSRTPNCAATSRSDCRARSHHPRVERLVPAAPSGRDNKPHRADRRWVNPWSPEQISKRLGVDFPDDESMRISHEAIYQALYVQGRGALKRELVACLRTGRALRVPKARSRQSAWGHVTPSVKAGQAQVGLDGDEIVAGHLVERRKVRNIRDDSRVALSFETGGHDERGLSISSCMGELVSRREAPRPFSRSLHTRTWDQASNSHRRQLPSPVTSPTSPWTGSQASGPGRGLAEIPRKSHGLRILCHEPGACSKW